MHVTKKNKSSNDICSLNLLLIILELNFIINPKEWWVNIGATHHIC